MKLFFLIILYFFCISCGKHSDASSLSISETRQCVLNDGLKSCDSGDTGAELLEVMVDVPVTISSDEILFLADRQSRVTGRKISCEINVKRGEVYKYTLVDTTLGLETKEGLLELIRLSDGEGVKGAWSWNAYADQGVHIIKNVTIIDSTRIILRTYCEL